MSFWNFSDVLVLSLDEKSKHVWRSLDWGSVLPTIAEKESRLTFCKGKYRKCTDCMGRRHDYPRLWESTVGWLAYPEWRMMVMSLLPGALLWPRHSNLHVGNGMATWPKRTAESSVLLVSSPLLSSLLLEGDSSLVFYSRFYSSQVSIATIKLIALTSLASIATRLNQQEVHAGSCLW